MNLTLATHTILRRHEHAFALRTEWRDHHDPK